MNPSDSFRKLDSKRSADFRQETVHAGVFTVGAEVLDFVLRMASLAILSHLLTPADFGLLAMVTAITSIAERFKDLGLTAATVQRPEITHGQVSTIFWVNTAVGLALAAVVALISPLLASFFREPRLAAVCVAISTSFLWSGASVQHAALLRRTMRFGRLAAIDTASSLASILVAVGMAMNGFGYWALVTREVLRAVLRAIGAWACMPWIPSFPSRGQGARGMLTFGGSVTGFGVLRLTGSSLGQIVVGRAFGAEALGIYRQAFQLVLVPIQHMSGPLRSVGEVALSRLQDDPRRYRVFYSRFLSLTSILTIPAMVYVFITADALVHLVLGPRWNAAAPLLRITALASLLSPSSTTAVAVSLSCGHASRILRFALIEAAALALLFVIGLPWGPRGVASAHIWVSILVSVPAVYWLFKDTPVRPGAFVTTVARPLVAAACMAGFLVLYLSHWPPRTAFVLGVAFSMGAGLYLTVLACLPGGRRELSDLWHDLRQGVSARADALG